MPEYTPVVVWGLVLGLMLMPAYVGPYRLILAFRKPWWPFAGVITYIVIANIIGCLAAGAVFVAVVKVSGINTAHPYAAYFGWSFLAGALLCRAAIEIRKRIRRNAA